MSLVTPRSGHSPRGDCAHAFWKKSSECSADWKYAWLTANAMHATSIEAMTKFAFGSALRDAKHPLITTIIRRCAEAVMSDSSDTPFENARRPPVKEVMKAHCASHPPIMAANARRRVHLLQPDTRNTV